MLQTLECNDDGEWHHSIKSIALSFEGKFLASTHECLIRVWNPATAAIHSTLEGHEGLVKQLEFSQDGQLASTSEDLTVRLWDPVTGVAHKVLTLEQPPVWDIWCLHPLIAFAPEGYLAIIDMHSKLRLWDWKAGTISDPFVLDFPVRAMVFLSDGRLVFRHPRWRESEIGAVPGVTLYDPTNGTVQSVISGVKLYDPTNGTVQSVIPAPVYAIATDTGNRLALGLENGSTLLYDLGTGAQKILECHRTSIASLAFPFDGRYLASVSIDGTLNIYNPMTHEDTSYAGEHVMVAFSHDGNLLASATCKTVQVWNPRIEAQTIPVKRDSEVSQQFEEIIFSYDGRQLAYGYRNGTVQLREVESRISLIIPTASKLDDHRPRFPAIAFSPNGSFLAFTLEDGDSIRIWDIATRSLHSVFEGYSWRVTILAFSSDTRQLASGGLYDGKVKIWDVATGDLLHVFYEHFPGPPSRLIFSPGSKQLVSGFHDGSIRVWDTGSGLLQFTVDSDIRWSHVTALAFSHGGDQLVSSNRDGEVCLWDPLTGSRLQVFDAKTQVHHLSFSADGRYTTY